MLARMAPGLRLQLDPYCRASFDSKSFAKVDVTDGQRDESRAHPVLLHKTLLHKTCASYCHILLLLLYQGSQELEVQSFNHPYSLKTKSSQCHYVVMTRSETKFQAPLNRRYQDVFGEK